MKVKITFDDNGYIQSFCAVGELEGSAEYEVDKEHFYENVAGYRLVNGELTFDKSYKQQAEYKRKTEVEIIELKKKLRDTDYQALKFAEGFISAEDYESIKAERQHWRDEINTLERNL
ncbi:MAG: DUF2977 domain-containing protein [Erysipelotrichia bacterium]|nr:DUF2977 domain-containing protein [Erysipelotrichia bacterium]